MATSSKYGDAATYQAKLKNIMERLKVKEYEFDYGLRGAWIDFKRNGVYKRFEYSLATAEVHGFKLTHGKDAFARLVMTLGYLEWSFRVGTYTFDMFLGGLPALPSSVSDGPLPLWAERMGFSGLPESAEEIGERYRKLARALHSDTGGKDADMAALNQAYEDAKRWAADNHV